MRNLRMYNAESQKSTAKVHILKKTTGPCPSRSYYTMTSPLVQYTVHSSLHGAILAPLAPCPHNLLPPHLNTLTPLFFPSSYFLSIIVLTFRLVYDRKLLLVSRAAKDIGAKSLYTSHLFSCSLVPVRIQLSLASVYLFLTA